MNGTRNDGAGRARFCGCSISTIALAASLLCGCVSSQLQNLENHVMSFNSRFRRGLAVDGVYKLYTAVILRDLCGGSNLRVRKSELKRADQLCRAVDYNGVIERYQKRNTQEGYPGVFLIGPHVRRRARGGKICIYVMNYNKRWIEAAELSVTARIRNKFGEQMEVSARAVFPGAGNSLYLPSGSWQAVCTRLYSNVYLDTIENAEFKLTRLKFLKGSHGGDYGF